MESLFAKLNSINEKHDLKIDLCEHIVQFIRGSIKLININRFGLPKISENRI